MSSLQLVFGTLFYWPWQQQWRTLSLHLFLHLQVCSGMHLMAIIPETVNVISYGRTQLRFVSTTYTLDSTLGQVCWRHCSIQWLICFYRARQCACVHLSTLFLSVPSELKLLRIYSIIFSRLYRWYRFIETWTKAKSLDSSNCSRDFYGWPDMIHVFLSPLQQQTLELIIANCSLWIVSDSRAAPLRCFKNGVAMLV